MPQWTGPKLRVQNPVRPKAAEQHVKASVVLTQGSSTGPPQRQSARTGTPTARQVGLDEVSPINLDGIKARPSEDEPHRS